MIKVIICMIVTSSTILCAPSNPHKGEQEIHVSANNYNCLTCAIFKPVKFSILYKANACADCKAPA